MTDRPKTKEKASTTEDETVRQFNGGPVALGVSERNLTRPAPYLITQGEELVGRRRDSQWEERKADLRLRVVS